MQNDIVRTLSVGQAVEIQDACRRQKVTLAELKMLTSSDNLRRGINWLNAAQPNLVQKPIADTFTISVDYSLSLEAMIAAGKYDWKNSNITAKRFPIKGTGIVERDLRLWHFDREIKSPHAERIICAAGEELSPIEDLLAFGVKYPDEQCKHPIIALGSSVYGRRHVAYLDRNGVERSLGLLWYGNGWHRSFRFLSRKVSVA